MNQLESPAGIALQCLADLTDSSEQAAERLVWLQGYVFNDLLGAGYEQWLSSVDSSNPTDLLVSQYRFCKGLEAHASFINDQACHVFSVVGEDTLCTLERSTNAMAHHLNSWFRWCA